MIVPVPPVASTVVDHTQVWPDAKREPACAEFQPIAVFIAADPTDVDSLTRESLPGAAVRGSCADAKKQGRRFASPPQKRCLIRHSSPNTKKPGVDRPVYLKSSWLFGSALSASADVGDKCGAHLVGLHVGNGIDRSTIDAHFVMQVRTG